MGIHYARLGCAKGIIFTSIYTKKQKTKSTQQLWSILTFTFILFTHRINEKHLFLVNKLKLKIELTV